VIDLAQAQPDAVFLAEDEAWMYLQATTMAVWSPTGQTPVTKVDPGRTKAGFYGTLNLRTGKELVTRTEIFNSQTTSAHLQSVLDTFPDSPIVLLWDRAKWHRGERAACRQPAPGDHRIANGCARPQSTGTGLEANASQDQS
jgi:hypothetical protein